MTLHRVDGHHALPLHGVQGTRLIETTLAAALPGHCLMQRAGQSLAQLAMALAPHAQTIWIACGPGNNGGDGLEAARVLHQSGWPVKASLLDSTQGRPQDALAALQRAQASGVDLVPSPPFLQSGDLIIDCLLGIGSSRAAQGAMAEWIAFMNQSDAIVLSADLPTGLDAETGQALLNENGSPGPVVQAKHTLMLLTAKPGLFMGAGRDAVGTMWLDDLTRQASERRIFEQTPAISQLNTPRFFAAPRLHNSHKGRYGDVAIVGGEMGTERGMGMTGAAWLAGSAALHAGAGRVWVSLLNTRSDVSMPEVMTTQPELMVKSFAALDLPQLTVVCGCGGGMAVKSVLAEVLQRSRQLVLDADALNAIAQDTQLAQLLKNRSTRARPTVLTPHPLEAARLLQCTTAEVQAQRLRSADILAHRWGCTVVLKGSGTVIACPGHISRINASGNGCLAAAGTGDVLAGWIGAKLAQGSGTASAAFEAASHVVYEHGHVADTWPPTSTLTASALAQRAH